MKTFDYYQPETLKEAFGLAEKFADRFKYIAGGTDLIVRIKQKDIQPDALISLRNIAELKGIRENGDLVLGSMTLIRDIERHPVIAKDYSALKQAASVLANPQIRNVATVGGNFCNAAPCADCAPPLLVMEALLVLEGPGGAREVPIDEFFKSPGETCLEPTEILKEIRIPNPQTPNTRTPNTKHQSTKHQNTKTKTRMSFLKTGRVSQDLAIASAAALVETEGKICRKLRLAAGSVAPTPIRLRQAEQLVNGQEITPDLLAQVSKTVEAEVIPISDIRSTEEYRRIVTGVLIRRAITEATEVRGER